MSFWADQFLEVCYRARQYSMALEESRPLIPAICLIQQRNLAVARLNLECALAVYQLCRQGQKETP